MTPRIRGVLLTLVLLSSICAPSAARADVTVDPNHTSVTFSVRHLTLTTVSGSVAVKDATVSLAPDDTLTSAKAELDLSTIDTRVTDRDNDLKSDRWFDVAHDPTMTFESTKITGDENALTIAGNLTFHGKTKPVGPHRTHIGYVATGVIDRTLWALGPGFPPAIVANEITLTIELEAIVT